MSLISGLSYKAGRYWYRDWFVWIVRPLSQNGRWDRNGNTNGSCFEYKTHGSEKSSLNVLLWIMNQLFAFTKRQVLDPVKTRGRFHIGQFGPRQFRNHSCWWFFKVYFFQEFYRPFRPVVLQIFVCPKWYLQSSDIGLVACFTDGHSYALSSSPSDELITVCPALTIRPEVSMIFFCNLKKNKIFDCHVWNRTKGINMEWIAQVIVVIGELWMGQVVILSFK